MTSKSENPKLDGDPNEILTVRLRREICHELGKLYVAEMQATTDHNALSPWDPWHVEIISALNEALSGGESRWPK